MIYGKEMTANKKIGGSRTRLVGSESSGHENKKVLAFVPISARKEANPEG